MGEFRVNGRQHESPPQWTESIAVGPYQSIEKTQLRLCNKVHYRFVSQGSEGAYVIKEMGLAIGCVGPTRPRF